MNIDIAPLPIRNVHRMVTIPPPGAAKVPVLRAIEVLPRRPVDIPSLQDAIEVLDVPPAVISSTSHTITPLEQPVLEGVLGFLSRSLKS